MGLYKLCEHDGRNRDRCEHPWWGSFRGVRVSLSRWTDREIRSKADASAALDELRQAIRARTFDPSGLNPIKAGPITFREFVALYRERHIIAKDLAIAGEYEAKVAPFLARFGDRALTDIRTADIEDVIVDLRKPRMIGRRPGLRPLTPATINRTVDRLRHMLNWAVGREYLERTPFKRGSATLIKKLLEATSGVGASMSTRKRRCCGRRRRTLRRCSSPRSTPGCGKARCWRSGSVTWTCRAV